MSRFARVFSAVARSAVRTVGLAVMVAVVSSATGCTHVKPWERGKLAHPTMTGMDNGPAAEHVYAVQEGAIGGGATAESGCGCN